MLTVDGLDCILLEIEGLAPVPNVAAVLTPKLKPLDVEVTVAVGIPNAAAEDDATTALKRVFEVAPDGAVPNEKGVAAEEVPGN